MSKFVEVQQFRQWWIILLIGVITAIVVGIFGDAVIVQIIIGRPFGDRPMPNGMLIATAVAALSIAGTIDWLILSARLQVTVTASEVQIHFRPLSRRAIALDEIESCRARIYHPLSEFGGWGIRKGFGATAYTVSGDRGVELRLRDGKRIMIGSQRPDELATAISTSLHTHRA